MAELPMERVKIGKVFQYTGVDYAGPFEIRVPGTTEDYLKKRLWVAIFVCLMTQAVHIEIVMDLTAVSFIACYERFISRRARCDKLFSNNGTCFVGAEKELEKAMEKWTDKEALDHSHSKGTGFSCHQQHLTKEVFMRPL